MSLKKINGYTIFLNKELGRGNFGVVIFRLAKVYEAQQDGTKIPCAVKMLDKMLSNCFCNNTVDSDDYIRSAIFRQIEILKNLKCTNIVGFYDVMQSSRFYYIVQQLCDTDLQKMMKKQQKFTQTQSIKYLTQICNGFLCLIKQGIVHRDLKPANIMIRSNNIKLGDFGLAKRCRNKRIKIDSSVGSPLYMSLELLKQQPYSSKCDIWAVGCVFYQMLHGKTPWHARTQYALVTAIQNEQLKINQSFSPNTIDFIKCCLQKTQSTRISWDDLFIHPIFNGHFTKYHKRNKQFQNKLKMIMSDIRFRINVENLELRKLMVEMGFDQGTQLAFKSFDQFIRIVNPSITTQEVIYFFEKLDVNDDGKVSIKQLESQMQKNHISLQMGYQSLYHNNNTSSITTNSFITTSLKKFRINQQLQYKIKKAFIKLFKILNDKKLTLFKTFKAYDQGKKGRLEEKQFERILIKLDPTFREREVKVLFQLMDKDGNKSIEFSELNAYYCTLNGVPEIVDLPPEHYYARGKVNYRFGEGQIKGMEHYFRK